MKKESRKFITDHPSYLVIKTSYPEKVLKLKDGEQINPEYMDWLNVMIEQIGFIMEEYKKEKLIKFLNKLNKPFLNEVQMRAMIVTKLSSLTDSGGKGELKR